MMTPQGALAAVTDAVLHPDAFADGDIALLCYFRPEWSFTGHL
jgi:hypothetical protein